MFSWVSCLLSQTRLGDLWVLVEQEAFMRYIYEILQNFGCGGLIEAPLDSYKVIHFSLDLVL